MKLLAILGLAFGMTIPPSAKAGSVEELWSHLFTNGPIVWHAPTEHLPTSFWIYKRDLPRIFPAWVITNGIVLGSLQSKGFPKPSTNHTCIVAEPPCPCGNVCNFFINPSEASMSFVSPDYKDGSPSGLPGDNDIAKRAWGYAPQLGLDPKQMVQESFFTHSFNTDKAGNETTNFVCGRGVFLSRQLDGVTFFSDEKTCDDVEGFSIEFGGYGQIRAFNFRWSNLRRHENQPTASHEQIIQCVKSHKAIVLPNSDEQDYFARLRTLATAKKLTITKITPYYGEGVFGEVPTNNVPCKFVTPLAELEAVADYGTSNSTLRLVSPLLSSEVERLLEGK